MTDLKIPEKTKVTIGAAHWDVVLTPDHYAESEGENARWTLLFSDYENSSLSKIDKNESMLTVNGMPWHVEVCMYGGVEPDDRGRTFFMEAWVWNPDLGAETIFSVPDKAMTEPGSYELIPQGSPARYTITLHITEAFLVSLKQQVFESNESCFGRHPLDLEPA